jgi:hypothetical protein
VHLILTFLSGSVLQLVLAVVLLVILAVLLALGAPFGRIRVQRFRGSQTQTYRFHDPLLARMATAARATFATMATEIPGFTRSVVSAADLSNGSAQFFCVTLDANGQLIVNTTANSVSFGVLQDKPAAGIAGEVMIAGRTKAVAGAAIAFASGMTPVTNDNLGRVVTATSGQKILGYLAPGTTPPSAAGQICSIELVRGAGLV